MKKFILLLAVLVAAFLLCNCTASKKQPARYLFLYKDSTGVIRWQDNATFEEVTFSRYGRNFKPNKN